MPNWADNEAFIKEQIDLTAINAYLAEKNAGDIDFKYTFFHIIVAALVKTVTLRPRMNRFIQGRTLEELNTSIGYESAPAEERDYAAAFVALPKISWVGHCMYCGHCAPCPAPPGIHPGSASPWQ